MEKRTLWIHAGGSKTGSSALQNFFELNTEYLNAQGFTYTNKVNIQSDREITSGNGLLLYEFLISSNILKEELNKIVLSYFEEFLPNALCSSEFFQNLNIASWNKLINIVEDNNIELRIVFYIRDVAPFFVSAYDQMIKRHGEWRDITEWSYEFDWEHLQSLQNLSQIFSKDKMLIYSYERSKSHLITSFLDAIGITVVNDEIFNKKTKHNKVNRSLTLKERELLRRINKEFGDKYSTEISDKLIYKNPDLVSEPEWDDSLMIQLADRYHNDIKWVNDSFFGSEAVVKIGDDISIKNSKNTLSEDDRQAVNDEVIEWCISKVKSLEINNLNNNISYVTNKLSAIDWENASNSVIPEDFNPFAYLLFNSDVLQSGESPYDHFIKYGQYEERKYQW